MLPAIVAHKTEGHCSDPFPAVFLQQIQRLQPKGIFLPQGQIPDVFRAVNKKIYSIVLAVQDHSVSLIVKGIIKVIDHFVGENTPVCGTPCPAAKIRQLLRFLRFYRNKYNIYGFLLQVRIGSGGASSRTQSRLRVRNREIRKQTFLIDPFSQRGWTSQSGGTSSVPITY